MSLNIGRYIVLGIILFVFSLPCKPQKNKVQAQSETSFNSIVPSWSPSGDKVVFAEGTVLQSELKLLDISTGEAETISSSEHEASLYPQWSPDGQWIAYLADKPENLSNNSRVRFDLWIMKPDGTDRRNLTESITDKRQQASLTFDFFEWSSDSNKLIFTLPNPEFDSSSIWMVLIDNQKIINLTSSLPNSLYFSPSFSPDGRQISYISTNANDLTKSSLNLADIDGDHLINIKSLLSDQHIIEAYWSPVGDNIAINVISGLDIEIMLVDIDGNAINLTGNLARLNRNPHWSPDGRYIGFRSSPKDAINSDIFVVDIDTLEAINITETDGTVYYRYIDWHPDTNSLIIEGITDEAINLWITDLENHELKLVY